MADFEVLDRAFAPEKPPTLTQRYAAALDNPNELQWVMSGLFLVYKSFLSSQDRNSCAFHPSCSEFGLLAVKKLGLVRGAICTFDRLNRCNALSPDQYEADRKRRKLLDPVAW